MTVQAPTCSTCGSVFDIGKRTSQERIDDAAARAGWILGRPRRAVYCPTCDTLPIGRT